MSSQISIDFSKPPRIADSGKKTERITFTASGDLKFFLNSVAGKSGESISELCQRYIIDGIKQDIGTMLITQANESKTLAELLSRS